MAHEDSVQALREQGDQFEKLIFDRIDELGPVLYPYADVWNKHIRPRRIGDGSALERAWMPFGGSHYTALIRLYHAHESKREVLHLCHELQETAGRELNPDDYAKLLRLHSACAAMWENLGSAIDNFWRAKFEAAKLFEINVEEDLKKCPTCDRPLANQYKTTGGRLNDSENPSLYHAYQRRTQFIHSRIVPTQIHEGMVLLNCLHFKDERTQWPADAVKPEQLDHIVTNDWASILAEFGSEWGKLLALLQDKDPGPAKEWSSGSTCFQSVSSPDGSAFDELINRSTSGNFNL